MRTTRLTLLILEQTEETPEPTRPVITTTGELVRARTVRNFRTAGHAEALEARLDGLCRWLGKVAS